SAQRWIRRVPVESLLAAFEEMRGALQSAAIPLMLLKGFYFADRLYGGLDRRPQHDLDILVRRTDFRQALRVLAGLGFARKTTDLHSHTITRAAVHVDLHRAP